MFTTFLALEILQKDERMALVHHTARGKSGLGIREQFAGFWALLGNQALTSVFDFIQLYSPYA